MGDRRRLDVRAGRIVERRHDDQDAVGAVGASFDHLIGVEDEVLAQRGEAGRRARRHQKIEMALERRRIRQDRQAGGAAVLIGLRKRGWIKSARISPLEGDAFFTSAISA